MLTDGPRLKRFSFQLRFRACRSRGGCAASGCELFRLTGGGFAWSKMAEDQIREFNATKCVATVFDEEADPDILRHDY